jgi:hypothetical protein
MEELNVVGIVVTLAAVALTAWFTARQVTQARRDDLVAGHLHQLAGVLTTGARDLRDVVYARDACVGCGAGVEDRRLFDVAERMDRDVDLALVYVRDRELRERLAKVAQAAEEVQRHRRKSRDGQHCDELIPAATSLAISCDKRAEECLNFVFAGRAVIPPRMPRRTPSEFLVDGAGSLLERVLLWWERRTATFSGSGR